MPRCHHRQVASPGTVARVSPTALPRPSVGRGAASLRRDWMRVGVVQTTVDGENRGGRSCTAQLLHMWPPVAICSPPRPAPYSAPFSKSIKGSHGGHREMKVKMILFRLRYLLAVHSLWRLGHCLAATLSHCFCAAGVSS